MKQAERYKAVIARFEKEMPVVQTELHYANPYQLLVAVILSAQCTDKRVNMITPALFEAYPTVEALAAATQDDIFGYIKSVSYPNNKSKALLGMARKLMSDFGGQVPDTMETLTSLPGVGRKTANVILSVIYEQPAMAVDTHVFRVAERLGLTTRSKTPLSTEKTLTENIPQEAIARDMSARPASPSAAPAFWPTYAVIASGLLQKRPAPWPKPSHSAIDTMDESNVFIFTIEVVGTIAFAISGIRLAAAKNFDWFGAYVVGLVTAIGGGTLRDVLLAVPVFWMQNSMFLLVTLISLIAVIIFRRALVGGMRTLFIFDAIGLALFVVVGIEKSFAAGYPEWVAIVMGIITGSFGGVTRDILINEAPLFFKKDIYATACLAGGVVYWLVEFIPGVPQMVPQIACAVAVIGLRIAAVHYDWSLPILKVPPEDLPKKL